MNDKTTTIEELKQQVKQFTEEREWVQYLSPKTIAVNMMLEASELLQHFAYTLEHESEQRLHDKKEEVCEELADVFYWVLEMSWMYKIDLTEIMQKKRVINTKKYPIEKARGKRAKYTEL